MNIPFRTWLNDNRPSDDMVYRGAFTRQIEFFGTLSGLFSRGLPPGEKVPLDVIGTHTSKSITLPVVTFTRRDIGLAVTFRDNFHDMKMSVVSARQVEADFAGLFHTTPPLDPEYTGDELSPSYFQGFPGELIFGYYGPSDRHQFSAQMQTEEEVFTAVYLLLRAVGALTDKTWHTEASHKAELVALVAAREKST